MLYNYDNVLYRVHMMHNLLYGDDVAIDDQVIFRDLDMDSASQHERVREIMDDIRIRNLDAIKHIEISNTVDNHDQCMVTSTLCHILTICDKLVRHDIIDEILTRHVILQPPTSLIIHHSLSNDAIIKLYAKTNAYNLLYCRIRYTCTLFYDRCDVASMYDMFRDATRNGLRVASIDVYNKFIDDNHIKYCTSLVELNIICGKITTCAPFAKSLKVLRVAFNNYIGNNSLVTCHSIKELYACCNREITTCAPFANSLEVLYATSDCGIGDDGLVSCRSIKTLYADNNRIITTCAPFANSLEILRATNDSGIGDDGLASCYSIKTLFAHSNIKITTCNPFAKTLTILDASLKCGIADVGIASCHTIKQLNAAGNPMITTCTPFAKSLTHLYTARSGIRTEGILSCKSLIALFTENDGKIDRSNITMAKNWRVKK